MKRSLKDIVVILKTINACLLLVGCWLNTTGTQAVNPQTWLMAETDSFRQFQCLTGSAGILSAIVCSHVCCFQPRCIGMLFNELTSECLVINATEKTEPCDVLNWAKWRPYRKSKVSRDACSDYLKHSGGYAYTQNYFGEDVASVHVADLYYTPASSGEVGGYTLSHPHSEVVKFDSAVTVRGVATQGRWRNYSISSCCDERVTAYRVEYSLDCMADWKFIKVDNDRIFEGNVIPDAGNEVVENMFDAPVTGKCFTLLDEDYHVNRVIRWDLVGC